MNIGFLEHAGECTSWVSSSTFGILVGMFPGIGMGHIHLFEGGSNNVFVKPLKPEDTKP